jgi:beta-1,2-mannobiose phosphorylase / 1,2-beta-oligomannan phosphorylase
VRDHERESTLSLKPYGLPVERLFNGAPIIRPIGGRWESGVTFNSAAIYLERSPANDPIIGGLLATDNLDSPVLREGVVALHYRARPKADRGYPWNRSYVGLAVFTPTLQLLKRYAEPILSPGERLQDPDYLGVEDPRITRIGDTFYAIYCGVAKGTQGSEWKAANCLASSRDLLSWHKHGPLQGNVNAANNKDGVLFPELIDGSYFLLHRPMVGQQSDFAINLAMSAAPDGIWQDCGVALRARPDPECAASWVGAGAVPIPLGGKRYLVIYHTGNLLHAGGREYDLDAAIFNFERFNPADPTTLVEKRLDRIMVPETETELYAPFSDSVANVLFTCGAYEYGGDLYIIYGGGDTFILAARVSMQRLLEHLEVSGG